MWSFILLTVLFISGLAIAQGLMRRNEIIANWAKYRMDPTYLFTAFLYRPDNDPRSRLQFTTDNFNDVLIAVITNTFKIFLEPVFKIFYMFMSAIQQTLGGLLNIHGLLGSMWKHFMQMCDIFMRRYAATFHQLRMTYAKIYSALQRVFAITMATVWQGFSTVYSTLSFIDLVIKICIIILIILVVIVLILWLFLWPMVPGLLIIIGIIITAGMGAAVGGMAGSLCFGENAQVVKENGSIAPISEIRIGDVLKGGAKVTAVMKFENTHGGFCDLFGIPVSGDHIVYTDGVANFVSKHENATPIQLPSNEYIYCLNTSTHKIPVVSPKNGKIYWFSDWEELENTDTEGLLMWNKEVWDILNPGCSWNPPRVVSLRSEAVIHPSLLVKTPEGVIRISDIRPGTIVIDADGKPTKVTGVVEMSSDEVVGSVNGIACGAWIQYPGSTKWEQIESETKDSATRWMSLFTEAGTYKLESDISVRDFTDVGIDNIPNTYSWILQRLSQK